MVLYRIGDFGSNLLRALVILWIKLAFFAMIGVACATFLSFPVATVLTLTVWTVLVGGGLVLEELDVLSSDGANPERLRTPVIRHAIEFLTAQLGSFSKPHTSSLLSDGRYVPWTDVLRHIATTGLLWTGATAFLACLVFRRREIARVQI